MKARIRSIVLLLLATFIAWLPGCGGEDEWICNSACSLDTGPVEVEQAGEFQYQAYAVGDGVFAEIRYLDDSEPEQTWQEAGAPIHVPWVRTGIYRPGMRLQIQAQGRLENGSLRVWFHPRLDSEAVSGSDTCEWVCSMYR